MAPLDTFCPEPRRVAILRGTRTVEVLPLTLRQMPAFIRAITPAMGHFLAGVPLGALVVAGLIFAVFIWAAAGVDPLEVYGLKASDLSRVSYVSYTDAVSLMKDNNAQVFTLGTTVPASAIMDLASARDIKIVAIGDDKFQAMRKLNPGYTKLVIPAGSYPKQTADVQTIDDIMEEARKGGVPPGWLREK